MATFRELMDGSSSSRLSPPPDDEAETLFPTLWSFITADLGDGKLKRTPPTITIQVENGGYVCRFQDHDLHRQVSVQVLRLTDAIAALERAMANPQTVWLEYKSKRNPKGIIEEVKENRPGQKKRK